MASRVKPCVAAIVLVTLIGQTWGLTLVKDGAPAATIIVPASALKPAKDDLRAQKIATAAADFQQYIRKISGAELPIASDDQAPEAHSCSSAAAGLSRKSVSLFPRA